MTRTEAVKEFFKKAVLPVAIARGCCTAFQIRLHQEWRAGSSLALDTLRPALRHPSDVRVDRAGRRLPGRRLALFVLNFIIGGLIGGFVLVWRLLVAAWYVPLTIYRLIVGY